MSESITQSTLDALSYAKGIRTKIIEAAIAPGIPDHTDLGRGEFVLKALKDMEDVELKLAKVRASDSANATSNQNAALMAEVMRRLTGNQPIRINTATDADLSLPEEFEQELIEGEAELQHRQIMLDELIEAGPAEDQGPE